MTTQDAIPHFLCPHCGKESSVRSTAIPPVVICPHCSKKTELGHIRHNDKGTIDYLKQTNAIVYEDWGFTLILWLYIDREMVCVWSPHIFRKPIGKVFRNNPDTWEHLLGEMLDRHHVLGWKESYYNPHIVDGDEWTLRLNVDGAEAITTEGCNDYPAVYESMLDSFSPVLKLGGFPPVRENWRMIPDSLFCEKSGVSILSELAQIYAGDSRSFEAALTRLLDANERLFDVIKEAWEDADTMRKLVYGGIITTPDFITKYDLELRSRWEEDDDDEEEFRDGLL